MFKFFKELLRIERLFLVFLVACTSLSSAHVLADNLYELQYPLIDDHGISAKLSDWRGKSAVIAMEYSNCKFICSTTLRVLKDIRQTADRQKNNIDILVISLDPKNDTPESWQHYRTTRNLNDGWHFFTSRSSDMPKIAAALGVKYWYYHEHIVHDLRVIRVNANGDVVSVITTFDADLDAFLKD